MIQEGKTNVHIYQILILLQCLIWGIGNPVTKYAYVSMTPFCYMTVRFGAAFLVFMLVFYKKIIPELNMKNIVNCSIVGIFLGGAYIFGNIALKFSMVTIIGFLMGISVVFTSIFSVLFLRKKLKGRFIVILAAVVVGMYMLCCGGNEGFSFGWGEIFAILSAASMAASLMLSAKYIKEVSPYTLSAIQCLITAVVCFIFALAVEDFSCMLHAEAISWISMVYLTLGCTVVTFMLQNVSIKHLSPVFISLAFCTEPLFTAAAAFFMLGEKLTLVGIAGCVLITAGVAAASLMDAEYEENNSSADVAEN